MHKFALTILTSAIASTAMAAESYTIDPNHTLPVFEVNHLGFSTQRGRFDKTAGKIHLDTEKKSGEVEWTIDANSIDMGQAKWNDHMKSEDFFNVAKFPTITFKSDKLTFKGDKPVAADGTLTLLGVSKPVKLAIHRFTCGENPMNKKPLCSADIEASLKRSEFGMTKYLPGVGDEVKVLVPVEAYKD
jgi:polyisoprenoid-binding protein YceI